MKIKFIVDSACGLSEKEAKDKGWEFFPLLLSIEGKDYFDGIDIDSKIFFDLIDINKTVKTAATPIGIAMEKINKCSKENDHIIIFTISTELSSQNQNILNIAKNFKNVHVIKSKSVGFLMVDILEFVEKQIDQYKKIEDVVEKITELSESQLGLLATNNMKWLVKGGRVSPAAAAMGNLLKIVPIIEFKDGKLDKYGKGRIFKKVIEKIAVAMKEIKTPNSKYTIYKANIANQEGLINKVKEILEEEVEVKFLPATIGAHTGPDILAIIKVELK